MANGFDPISFLRFMFSQGQGGNPALGGLQASNLPGPQYTAPGEMHRNSGAPFNALTKSYTSPNAMPYQDIMNTVNWGQLFGGAPQPSQPAKPIQPQPSSMGVDPRDPLWGGKL